MLIVLDDSLADSIEQDPNDSNVSSIAIDAIADSVRQGIHVLTGSFKTLERLSARRDVFRPRTIEIIRRAKNKLAFRKEMLDTVLWRLRVVANRSTFLIESLLDEQTEVLLPSSVIANNTSLVGRPKFIAENSNDASFYNALIRGYAESTPELLRRFAKINFRFQIAPGGGSTTAPLYALEKSQCNSVCLAIVDSDKRFPTGTHGDTAKKLLELDRPPNTKSWNMRAIVIESRTIENVFPELVLKQVAEELDPQISSSAEFLCANHYNTAHWQYLPLKKGIKCFDLCGSSGEAEFWRPILGFDRCPLAALPVCAKRERCGTYAIPPLGDGLLAAASKNLDTGPLDLTTEPQLAMIIKPIFLEALSTFCGDEPMIGA